MATVRRGLRKIKERKMKKVMNERLSRITDEAINFIRNAEKLALRMDERGFHVAFSGGKDSQVLLALIEMANVKHHAEMQVTSVDSPNIMRFVRKYYSQVRLNLPKRNMRQLILDKGMLPTRRARFCCSELKEKAGAGCCTCIGIRKAESSSRKKRHSVEVIGQRVGYDIVTGELQEQNNWGGQLFDNDQPTNVYCVDGKDKVVISPIFDWTDNDIWAFIYKHNLPYCDLYDKGFHRIGCLFCPMASLKEKAREMQMFPKFAEKVYIRTIRELMKKGKYDQFRTPEQVFQWWVSNESAKDWLAHQDLPSLFND